MTKKIVLMRGIPGSGKSTKAQFIYEGVVISTDDYFMAGDRYLFDPTKVGDAHAWNRDRCRKLMADGAETIVIDNTNIKAWEMKPYVLMAKEHGYSVEFKSTIDTCGTAKECFLRNAHGVPLAVIERMFKAYEVLPENNEEAVAAILNARFSMRDA